MVELVVFGDTFLKKNHEKLIAFQLKNEVNISGGTQDEEKSSRVPPPSVPSLLPFFPIPSRLAELW